MKKAAFDLRDVMRCLPPNGEVRHAIRQFNLAPNLDGKARSVKELAQVLGFSVVRCALPGRMTGRLVADAFSENGYCIEVNEKHSVQAQRFAVLHEIGHFFRHTDRSDPLSWDMAFDASGDRFYENPQEEREANEFAAAVLFGGGALEAASSLYNRDVGRLARHFGVSERTVEIALKQFLRR